MQKPMTLSVILLCACTLEAIAQVHPHPTQRTPAERDSAMRADSMMSAHRAMQLMMGPLGIMMNRDGSGTSWLPDSTPMYAMHRTTGPWLLMLHGNVFAQHLWEGSDRGDNQFGSINWLMGMAVREAAGGKLALRSMLSAEPLTVGECGYPDLLATGESCEGGRLLHDRQHPHDLFMELAGTYDRELTRNLAFQLYGAPVGEPALGPVAYPHRVSAMPNPVAPIGHHWLDATHISFGVATIGVYSRIWKLEGSLFNGREPDENRYDLDLNSLDSYSGRLWVLPNGNWALQASAGRLNHVEPGRNGEPSRDQTRMTASATYHRLLKKQGVWASTVAWGRDAESDHSTNAFLIETNVDLDERNVFFARGEADQKTGDDLVLQDPTLAERRFGVGTINGGYARLFGPVGSLMVSVGARGSINFVPADLERFYGSRHPLGVGVFLNVRPRVMKMMHMDSTMKAMPMKHGMPPRH